MLSAEHGGDRDVADWDFTTPDLGSALLGQVFALGESNKELLGVLPYAAWDEYAADGRIVAAVTQAGDLAGYCAFRLPRNEVILTHLVVSPEWRGTGIAQALVLELSARYRDRRGLRAKCRRDYEAHSAWPRLGFVPVGDRPGRGRDGTPLTMWWRDHGHADLLSWQGSTASVTSVVMDANVFFDLNPTDPAQPVAQSVQWLLVEVDRQKDPQRRASLKSAANAYPRLVVDPDRFDVAVVVLRASGRPTVSRQDESDLRHVAYAAAAGVQVVVTRDGEAMRKYADLARESWAYAFWSRGSWSPIWMSLSSLRPTGLQRFWEPGTRFAR